MLQRDAKFAIPAKYIAEITIANPGGILQHAGKHRLKVAGDAGDNPKHLRRGRLLLQRLVQFARELRDLGSRLISSRAARALALGTAALQLQRLAGRALAGLPPALEGFFIASTHLAGNEAS